MTEREAINQLIGSMGVKFRAELAQRTAPFPDWFPVHQAFTLAATQTFFALPEAIRRVLLRTSPEKLAQQGRCLHPRISPLATWMLGYQFLVGREMLIDLGVVKASAHSDDVAVVLDFWRRLTFLHRGDGHLDNSEAGAANVYLPSSLVQQLYDALVPLDAGIRRQVGQFLQTASEYLLLANAEAPLGSVATGPYPLHLERVLISLHYFDLKAAYTPWYEVVADLPYETCALAFTFDPADFHSLELSDRGELQTMPVEYVDCMREIAFVAPDGDRVRVLPFTEMDWLVRMMRKVRPKVEAWFNRRSRRERITAGAIPWIVRPFAVLAGEEAYRAREFMSQALQLLPRYEDDDLQAARWMTHRCLAPGNLSAFVALG